jgi:soluble lytic murein transglycosylase-like protein
MGGCVAFGQADAIRAAMEASLAKQRESVRAQVAAAVPVAGQTPSSPDFFTIPWPKPVQMLAADCDPLPKARVDELVTQASSREGLKPDLLFEVMRRESAFKPCAVSVKGAQGLMQLMPATAEQFGVKDPFDPEQNVSAGAKFLKQLLGRYNGDLNLALAAYNAGPGAVDKAHGVPAIAETQNYVSAITGKL